MTPEIKHVLETIRDECRKHDCCNRHCELFNPSFEFGNGESPCLISKLIPYYWTSERGEDESNGRMD